MYFVTPNAGTTRVNCSTSAKSFFIAGAIGGEAVELLCLSPGNVNDEVMR